MLIQFLRSPPRAMFALFVVFMFFAAKAEAQLPGACCVPTGGCVSTSAAACSAQNGNFLGSGTSCAGASCGACCLPIGTCINGSSFHCSAIGGVFQGSGTVCGASAFCAITATNSCNLSLLVAPLSSTPELITGSTIGFTRDTAFGNCVIQSTSPNAFFRFIGNGSVVTITTCDATIPGAIADFDTNISVYVGGCAEPVCVLGGSDNCVGGSSNRLTTLTFCSQPGTEYTVMIHGFGQATGTFTVGIVGHGTDCGAVGACCYNNGGCFQRTALECTSDGGVFRGAGTSCATESCPDLRPPNDLCTGAFPIVVDGPTVSGSTSTASPDVGFVGCGSQSGVVSPGVWYSVIGDGTTLRASTCYPGTNYNTFLRVYTGENCFPLTCVGLNDDAGSMVCPLLPNSSFVEWCSSPGQVYHVFVHGLGTSSGHYELGVTSNGFGCVNDGCIDALPVTISGPSVFGETISATGSTLPSACGSTVGLASGGRWYSLIGDGTVLTASTCNPGTDFDTVLRVFRGVECSSALCIGLNDDAGVSGCAQAPTRSVVEFCTVEGEIYRLYVHGRFADSVGQYELTVTSSMDDCPPCPCDRNGDRVQNVGDYFDFLTEFFDQLGGPGTADIDGDGVVTVGDYFVFLGCLPVIATNTQCP